MNGATQQVITTGYAVDGRIKSAGFEHDGVIQQFAYGYLPGSHLLQSLAMPNGVVLTQSYEGNRDLLTDMVYLNNETALAKRTYSYDAIGRPTARGWLQEESRRDDAFAYNNRSELIGATLGQQGYSYAYDNIGNRESAQEADEKATTYSTNELNQYTVIQEDEHGVFEPQFDAAGNQTLVKTKTGIWRVIYNAENRPVKFTSENGSTIVECAYDYMYGMPRLQEGDHQWEGNAAPALHLLRLPTDRMICSKPIIPHSGTSFGIRPNPSLRDLLLSARIMSGTHTAGISPKTSAKSMGKRAISGRYTLIHPTVR